MKSAKIMLIAIAVVATVGGALAFKSQKSLQNVYCKDSEGTCLKKAFRTIASGSNFYTTPCTNDHPAAFTSSYYTTDNCPGTAIKVVRVTDETNE